MVALAFSIVATETSTLTIIGTPALAYAGNMTFLQWRVRYLVGRPVPGQADFSSLFFAGEFPDGLLRWFEKRSGQRMRSGPAVRFLASAHARRGVCARRGDALGVRRSLEPQRLAVFI